MDSVRDYFDLIEHDRYKASLRATNVNDCITAIKNGGYATSPTYIQTINNIYNQNKSLIERHKVQAKETGTQTQSFQFHNPIQTNIQFAETAMFIANNTKTYYVNGAWGWPMTQSNKQRAINNGTSYNKRNAAAIMALPDGVWGWDCICLLKGICWGWCNDWNKSYGGAGYACNGVPDSPENVMIQRCNGVTTDFSNVQVGEMLWLDGHAGIYIGNGLGVECTPSWKNGVQITAVLNIGKKDGYNGRKWTKHGMLPYFKYIGGTVQQPSVPSQPSFPPGSADLSRYTDEQLARMVLDNKFGNGDVRKKALGNRYRAVQDIVNRIVAGQNNSWQEYTVKPGDTLSAIGNKFGVPFMKIAIDNNIANPNIIFPGQKIVIKK